MLLQGIFLCFISFSINAFEAVVYRDSKVQEGFKLPIINYPVIHKPKPPKGLPPSSSKRRVSIKEKDKYDCLPTLIPQPKLRYVASPVLHSEQSTDYCNQFNRTFRVRDGKRILTLLNLNRKQAPAQTPEDSPEFSHLWINIGEQLLDACKHGDLIRLKAALFFGKEKGLTVNTSHNGHYPLAEVSTVACANFLLSEGARLQVKNEEKSYTITNIHLSKLLLALQYEPARPSKESKLRTIQEESKKIIQLLAEHGNGREKIKLHRCWNTAIRKYKKAYGKLNYTDDLPSDDAFFGLIKILIPLD
jgi:hypothetical protein